MEWLTLVLLIPAILIPLVLLLGFSGCSFEPGRAPSLPASPVLISAIPGDETSITLSWANPEMASVEFEVERQPPFATPPAPITTTTFTDRFLSAGAEFAYTVRARRTEDGAATKRGTEIGVRSR